jgi:hypothetical protein
MKKITAILGTILLVGSVSFGQTLEDTADSLASTNDSLSKKVQDQSTYATLNDRHGTIVRHYDFDVHGGAVGTNYLEFTSGSTNETGRYETGIPDGAVIVGGYIQVHSALLPTDGTHSLGLDSAVDVLANGNDLESTGITAVVPDWTGANAIEVDGVTPLNFVVSGTAYTSGVFTVVLDYYQGRK